MLTLDQLIKTLKDSSRDMQLALAKNDLELTRACLALQIRAFSKLWKASVTHSEALPAEKCLPPLPACLNAS